MSSIGPTIITTADSEGNAAQIHVTGEAIVIHTAEGAAPTGIDLAPTDAAYFVQAANAVLSNEWTLAAGTSVTFSDDSGTKVRTINSTGAADPDSQIL